MDMQKEVRSFESEFPAPETIQFNERFGFYESVDSVEDARHQNILWKGWLACAKASAVPDGYVVVPKEPTAKMIDATWDYDDEIQNMSHNTRNEFIYRAMIEAAQENTDGAQ